MVCGANSPHDGSCALRFSGFCGEGSTHNDERREAKMLLILLVILLLLSLGSFPAWPYSRGWGYYPSGGLGVVALVLILLLLFGRF